MPVSSRLAPTFDPLTPGSPLRPSPLGQSKPAKPTPVLTRAAAHSRSPSEISAASLVSDEGPEASLSRSHPLLGSYPLSLLHSRMSAAPHANTSFELHMKAVGIGKCDPEIRAPRALTLPFTAQCYDLGERQSPWVGDVDVERYFFDTYAASELPTSSQPPSPDRYSVSPSPSPVKGSTATPLLDAAEQPPAYPGYRVPPVGQLQLLIRTPTAAVKAFILPYDLTAVQVGGRLLARERTYVSRQSSQASPAPRGESLRFAVQLQFVCTRAAKRRQYYVSRCIKLVFAAGPGSTDTEGELRVERHDEVVPPERRRRRESSPEAVRRRSLLASSPAERRRSSFAIASSPIDSPPQRRSAFSPDMAGSLGSPRQSLGQTMESWAAIRHEWQRREAEEAEEAEAGEHVEAGMLAAIGEPVQTVQTGEQAELKGPAEHKQEPTDEATSRPRLRRMPTRLEGFEPPPARPTSPTPPRAQPSLLSALRAVSTTTATSEPQTPRKSRPAQPAQPARPARPEVAELALERRATPPLSPRRRTSAVEKELSELLRSSRI